MKTRLTAGLLVLLLPAWAVQWQLALPGYRYQFPRDHFSHPDYQTEWWYYTGNLRSPDGHRFGFELTFFRQALNLPKVDLPKPIAASSDVIWRPDQIYLAHLALSDIDGREFYHTERLNRAGPGLAGVDAGQGRYWNGNWQVRWIPTVTGAQKLEAVCRRFTLQLDLTPEKPLVIHGENGVSQKGPEIGQASHYISFTRLRAGGQLRWNGASLSLSGLAWMDHEFFTEGINSTDAGWDWFAIQLQNNEELMLYRLRKQSGEAAPYSSGTYVDAHGESHFLHGSQFSLSPGAVWQSPNSGARYPLEWEIRIPSIDLELSERTSLNNQELFSRDQTVPSYWEGAVTYSGHVHAQPVSGVGYLEMTGYAKTVRLGAKRITPEPPSRFESHYSPAAGQ
ncbi:MAG: lipocalin-like domain-containing protein [Bryobacteraceae bacterium]